MAAWSTLRRLDRAALRHLAERMLPGYDPISLDRVVRRVATDSAGLPLFAVELLRAVALGLDLGTIAGTWPEPLRTLDQSLPGDLPDAVVAAIRVAFRRLSPAAQRVLVSAAVPGRSGGARGARACARDGRGRRGPRAGRAGMAPVAGVRAARVLVRRADRAAGGAAGDGHARPAAPGARGGEGSEPRMTGRPGTLRALERLLPEERLLFRPRKEGPTDATPDHHPELDAARTGVWTAAGVHSAGAVVAGLRARNGAHAVRSSP